MKNRRRHRGRFMLKRYLVNCRNPQGRYGKRIVSAMNFGHAPLNKWVYENVVFTDGGSVLDVGCGGGGNLLRMLEMCPHSRIDGADYSATSVEKSREYTAEYADRCYVTCCDVADMPFEDGTYDTVTAFETVYFWHDPVKCFGQIRRVLKSGGRVVVACEMIDPEKGKFWTKRCEGMTVYSVEELCEIVRKAGFKNVASKVCKNWGLVTAVAP